MSTVLFTVLTALGQVNTNHIWSFEKGGKFEAFPVSFKGTNIVNMLLVKDHKGYPIQISQLVENDQKILIVLRSAWKPKKREKDKKQMEAKGYSEFSVKLLRNFPEKVENQMVWADVRFVRLDGDQIADRMNHHTEDMLRSITGQSRSNDKDWREEIFGFEILDADGSRFDSCLAGKTAKNFGELIPSLKPGEEIRILGFVESKMEDHTWLYVNSIEKLEDEIVMP